MGGLLVLVGLLGMVLGAVCVVKPMRGVWIPTRRRALATVGASFILMMVGGAMLPPKPNAAESGGEVAQAIGAEPTAPPEPTATKAARCQDVPAALVAGISEGLKGGTSLVGAQAVKSNDYVNAYFVSAYIEGPGVPARTMIGTWVTNRIDGSAGLLLSVSGGATEFSSWGDGTRTQAQFSMSKDGATVSRKCVQAK